MGLFGSTKIYVSSVLYNLAGDVEGRGNFLKSTLAGSVITDKQVSKGETIRNSYLAGQGMKLRNYYRWAQDNYTAIGIPTGTIHSVKEISPDAVKTQIPVDAGQTALVQTVQTGQADFAFWAEQWMFENEPALIGTNWVADYNDATGEIVITFEDTTIHRFIPVNFDKTARYIFATYMIAEGKQEGEIIPGTRTILGSADDYPSTSGWDTIQNDTLNATAELKTVVKTDITYSDGRPAQSSSTSSTTAQIWTQYKGIFSKTNYEGNEDPSFDDRMTAHKQIMTQERRASIIPQIVVGNPTTETITGGVIKTTVVTTTTDQLVFERSSEIDTQDITLKSWSTSKIYIYKLGSGNAVLDALASTTQGTTENDGYLPFIPVRLDNQFLSAIHMPDAYALAKKAYKKSVNGKLDDLISKLTDNPSLKDIDYAYIMFGVPLNTKDNSSRKYLYRFFQAMMNSQQADRSGLAHFQQKNAQNDASLDDWIAWRQAQSDSGNILYGTPEPTLNESWGAPTTEVDIKSSGLNTNMDMRLTWSAITESHGDGLLKDDAKVGELWIEHGANTSIMKDLLMSGELFRAKMGEAGTLDICWQVNAGTWRKISITGLVHRNYIYKGKYVETTVADAMADTDESSLLIPISHKILTTMPLVDATQMATECAFLVLNCYKVVKQKWYQTGIFKIILIIVVIAIVFFTGQFEAVGLLGTSAAVGAALGLSGIAAIIAGYIVNTIAAMILLKIIQAGATAIFGDKLGAIIGAVVGFAALAVGVPMANGSSFSSAITSMLNPKNLIALTSSVGHGVSGMIQADIQGIVKQTQDFQTNYQEQSKEISDLYAQNIGYGNGQINPMDLIDAPGPIIENRESFLSRTLMTGSDIAEISVNLITKFTEVTLTTELQL